MGRSHAAAAPHRNIIGKMKKARHRVSSLTKFKSNYRRDFVRGGSRAHSDYTNTQIPGRPGIRGVRPPPPPSGVPENRNERGKNERKKEEDGHGRRKNR
jgi:hypothetical protein